MLHATQSGNKSASDEKQRRLLFTGRHAGRRENRDNARIAVRAQGENITVAHAQALQNGTVKYQIKRDHLQGARHSAKFRRHDVRESRFGPASDMSGRRFGVQHGVQWKQTSQSVQLSALQPIGNRRLSGRPAAARAEADSAEL